MFSFFITIVFHKHFYYIQTLSQISRLRVNKGLLYCIVLYCIVSYRIVSYRIVSYRIVSYRIVSYRIVSYRIVSYRIVLCRSMLCVCCSVQDEMKDLKQKVTTQIDLGNA